MTVAQKRKDSPSGFSSIECIGGRDISEVKPVFSSNNELLYLANGNKVDVHSVHSGDYSHSFHSEVSITDNIIALFLNPLNNNILVGVFDSAHVVVWNIDNGNIENTYKLSGTQSNEFIKVKTAKCHINIFDESSVDIYAVVQTSSGTVLKVYSNENGKERNIKHNNIKNLQLEDVGSLNIISFGGPQHIWCNEKNMSGRFISIITGPKLYVVFLKCLFEPRLESQTAIYNSQEIRLKFCWYQLGNKRTYTAVTCHPEDYVVSVGDDTGRVIVYTGVFLHAEDTRIVCKETKRVRRISMDKLNDESDSDEDREKDSRVSNKANPKSPGRDNSNKESEKKVSISRNWSWAISSIYHWHSFPVKDVAFSESGNFIFSGGGERAIAEWELPHCKKPRTVPRLPGTISNITKSSAGILVVSTKDNSLHLLDQTSFLMKKVLTSIQRLARDEYQKESKGFLVYDPRTSSLVFNSRKGHVQFYSAMSRSLLFHLDITEENIISEIHHNPGKKLEEKQGTTVSHSEVVSVTISHDGLCLASVESLEGDHILKFWSYSSENKVFRLSNVISKPHQGQPINFVKFSPSRAELSDNYSYTCATSGGDNNYILWCCQEKENKYIWSKLKEDNYHELPVGPVDFSQDGSSLAVSFGPCITLWDRHFDFKCSLSHVCDKSKTHYIQHLAWGQGTDCSHLIVGACSEWVRVWNTILGHNVWQVPLKISLLVTDSFTNNMALFTHSQKIYIFSPSSPKPLSIISTKDHNPVSAACFCPTSISSDKKVNRQWYEETQLFYLTTKMELMFVKMLDSFEVQTREAPFVPFKPLEIKTPFSSMIAEKTSFEENKVDKHLPELKADPLNMGSVDKFLTYNSVSMPPLELLSAQLIKSTLDRKAEVQEESKVEEDVPMEDIMSITVQEIVKPQITLDIMDDSCLQWIQNLV